MVYWGWLFVAFLAGWIAALLAVSDAIDELRHQRDAYCDSWMEISSRRFSDATPGSTPGCVVAAQKALTVGRKPV